MVSEDESDVSASKPKIRGKKRKREESESSSDIDDSLPENALEVERNVQTAAIKNNLDDVSVKKILKKVVTNDHVLALVKLREEEEIAAQEKESLQPKLTRAKAKELMKVSPKSAPWNLELTPIKHIPVKTRPEVEELITKELPEDEDDEEYKPTPDDVPSDDDQTIETCSDVDSQPATPATPSTPRAEPYPSRLHTDGPFKVPAPGTTPTRRKLVIDEEEATIALRTRSKVSLAATSIEHIESSFVPPDDLPTPIGDDLWNQFLEECLNPAEVSLSKHEDDDDADPEYNVHADTDAHDEDEESRILRISKKELNDLVNELFNIMPSEPGATDQLAADLASKVLTDAPGAAPQPAVIPWEGKQEPVSDEEKDKPEIQIQPIVPEQDSNKRLSIGKTEPADDQDSDSDDQSDSEREDWTPKTKPKRKFRKPRKVVKVTVSEKRFPVQVASCEGAAAGGGVGGAGGAGRMPAALRRLPAFTNVSELRLRVHGQVQMQQQQVAILQQQLRQHIQLAASNYLQLYVNPAHWALAPVYKEYLMQLNKMLESNPKSVVNVCNLKPAVELVASWESSVSTDTLENKKLVEFVQKEAERGRRAYAQHRLYKGNFPELFMQVVANSPVFQYPYLLPAVPYRADNNRRFGYLRSEDELIALGLDQFWDYVEANPDLYPRPRHTHGRWGLVAASTLVCKHMLPWITPKWLQAHVLRARRDKDNAIGKFFESREVTPVTHLLLPVNPQMTLYEQPEREMPRAWVRYLAKTSKRFRYHYYRPPGTGVPPNGVPVDVDITAPIKKPLPIDFTKEIPCYRQNIKPKEPEILYNKLDLLVQNTNQTFTGPMLTINPITPNANCNNIISVRNDTQPPPGKVAIPLNPYSTTFPAKTTHNSTVNTTKVNTSQSQIQTNIPILQDLTSINSSASNDYTIVSNMFRVVQTSLGGYLVPLTIQKNTNTVGSITGPISSFSSNSIIGNNLPESSKNPTEEPQRKSNSDASSKHCECCVLLRKICKEKQSRITDFFKGKKTDEKPCDCSSRKFPNISKRFRMLLNSYRSRSCCEQRRIKTMLRAEEETTKTDKCIDDEDCSLEDIEFVTTFHMKLTRQCTLSTNDNIKSQVDSMFSNFDLDLDNPVKFSEELFNVFGAELADLRKEFTGFLTPEQADRTGKFKEHFIHNCIGSFVKRVEAEVHNKEHRDAILNRLNRIFTDNTSTSCELCAGVLATLTHYPPLAKHVFSLFPHRVAARTKESQQAPLKVIDESYLKSNPTEDATSQPKDSIDKNSDTIPQNTIVNHDINKISCEANECDNVNECDTCGDNETETLIVMDCEPDNSSGEEIDVENIESAPKEPKAETITEEHLQTKEADPEHNVVEGSVVNKNETQDYSDSTVMSPLYMSEDDPNEIEIKKETVHWTREEDKYILQTILKNVTPEQKKNRTVLEILEEKNVYQLILNKCLDKCIDDIKNRVLHILEIVQEIKK